jgi:pseudouridine kinase
MAKPVVCIGGALIDELYYARQPMVLATTNISSMEQTAGGVSRNLAHQLALFGVPVELISVFGDDVQGNWLKHVCESVGIGLTASVFAPAGNTGKYTGIINADGSLFTAMLTNASNQLITPAHLHQHEALLSSASYLLADTNLTADALQWLINFSNLHNVPLIIEPVSVPPAKKLAALDLAGVYMITPNEDELPVICQPFVAGTEPQVGQLLDRGVQHVWLHTGAQGSVLYKARSNMALHAPLVNIQDCTGAGDASLAGWVLGKWLGKNDMECLQMAHTLAAEVLQVKGSIATSLNLRLLFEAVDKYFGEAK